jgi:ribosomal protein S27AE
MSLIENLKYIKENGIDAFLETEKQKRTCPSCGAVICVHNKRCYTCNP